MPRRDNLYELPKDLPVPMDDGGCSHLKGLALVSIPLMSTNGEKVDVAGLSGRTVVFCYPRTGLPDRDSPPGWDRIPGARGFTPQACSFRDHFAAIRRLGARLFGLSTQDSDYQREAVRRLRLPFEMLSDSALAFTEALRLPVFEFEGTVLLKRVTLILDTGKVLKVFYPVFPPDENAREVVEWLSQNEKAAVYKTS